MEDNESSKTVVLDRKWEKKFQELIEFVKMHNHFIVGKGPLEGWVHRQRVEHRQGKLHPQRIKKLEEIGFPWNPKDDKWNEKFQELTNAYSNKEIYSPSSLLAKWVVKQKHLYREGKLTTWKIEKLNSLCFDWNLTSNSSATTTYHSVSHDYQLPQRRLVIPATKTFSLNLNQVHLQPLQLSQVIQQQPTLLINPNLSTESFTVLQDPKVTVSGNITH